MRKKIIPWASIFALFLNFFFYGTRWPFLITLLLCLALNYIVFKEPKHAKIMIQTLLALILLPILFMIIFLIGIGLGIIPE